MYLVDGSLEYLQGNRLSSPTSLQTPPLDICDFLMLTYTDVIPGTAHQGPHHTEDRKTTVRFATVLSMKHTAHSYVLLSIRALSTLHGIPATLASLLLLCPVT